MIKYYTGKSGNIAELPGDSVKMVNYDDLLQLMADSWYTHSVQSVIIHAVSLPPEFFNLKSGIAGDILQKFSNYRMKLAIVGDFSDVRSKSLRAFIRESNERKIISFVASVNEALAILDK